MDTKMSRHLFCFGLGYTGFELAVNLRKLGWSVSGTTRDQSSQSRLKSSGFKVYTFDGTQPLPDAVFDGVSHILLSIPPGEDGDPAFNQHGKDLVARVSKLKWVGYLSTTGVYGDRQGGWVDETSDLTPSTRRGEKRLAAEQKWLELYRQSGLPVHLFRLAGIYGPGSNQLEKVADGKARRRVKQGQVFSRIHLDDIIGILLASMENPNPGTAYNVCDDEAVPPQDVVTYAAQLLGMKPPPEIPFDPENMTPMGRSFFAESKQVSNQKIKDELGYRLKYPTYREGLKALLPSLGQSK
jgi:nucleoside-diphosphate-sugar epimerase